MIRPRAGNFVYSSSEFQEMLAEIQEMKKFPISGVVIGTLTNNNEINFSQLQSLVETARPLSVTFHRAFDWIVNKEEAVVTLMKLQVDRVLTSGCSTNAFEGRFILRKLVDLVNDLTKNPKNIEIHCQSECHFQHDQTRSITRTDHLVVVAAGGVRVWNVEEIVHTSHVTEVHSSQPFHLPKSLSIED
jgi:copper homeostasis protein CutC